MTRNFCLALILTSASAFAQSTEVILLGHYGRYDPGVRSADRMLGVELYTKLTPVWKVFAGTAIQKRFGESDQSVGVGAYCVPDRENSFFANVQVGFSPEVIPAADVSAEYARTVAGSFAVSLLYRYMGFTDATVHILSPSTTVYAFQGWELTARVYLSDLVGSSSLAGSFLIQAWYEPSDTWSPGISYAVGNEAYRAGSLADVTTASSWSTTISGKVRLSESVRLRLSFEHLNRIGTYHLNTVFLSLAYGW